MKNIYIKRLSGDLLNIILSELNDLNKKVLRTLEDIKEDFTIYHPYKVYYRSVLYPNRPHEKNILYFPPSISNFRHPYRLFPLEVEEEESIKDGDIYGIVTYEDLKANIDFSSSFNSNDKYIYKNISFYVFIYKINFKLETITQTNPYKDPEILYVCQTIEIRLLKRTTFSSLVIPYSQIKDIENNQDSNQDNNHNFLYDIEKIEKPLFEALYHCKELSDFNPETRTSIVNELINFINGRIPHWDIYYNSLIDLDF